MTTKFIGDYQYEESNVLGAGAFGTVYKGRHRRDAAMIVAVKRIAMIIPAFKKPDKGTLEREIEILRALSAEPHRHIVRQLHFERAVDAIYIVMEFCNGGSLQKYIEDKGERLDEGTIKLFVKQIVNGMIVLHQKNIIHRDLKPDNIMLCLNPTQANPPPRDITLKIGYKETAFVYAIRSSAVSYYVTQACSQGNLSGCGCDREVWEGRSAPQGWKWGGCSANYKYGLQFRSGKTQGRS